MIRVGVVGGTGYTGVELLRLLLCHPDVTVSVITSRSEAGRRLDDLFRSLLGTCALAFGSWLAPSPSVSGSATALAP